MTQAPLIRIVDDDEQLLQSQRMLLGSLGWEVVAYRSGIEFLNRDALRRPGCLVLDVRMPGMTGLEVQEELVQRGAAKISIIFLTGHGDVSMAVHTMQRGAVDFVQKPADPHQMLETVARAVTRSVAREPRLNAIARMQELVGRLSPRETDVARCIARGLRNKEIAQELGIEETTVKMHRANALIKLDAKSSAELVRIFAILDFHGEE